MHFEAKHSSTDTRRGNIWILWNASIQTPKIVSSTDQSITIEVGNTLVTGIHAASLTTDRRTLWREMEILSSLDKPWLTIGDFNAILKEEEKKWGLRPLRISMLEFNDCLHNCGLIQAGKSGLEYSWSNNRAGKKRIVCNLDRAVYNAKWLDLFPSWSYKMGARGVYDHSTLYGANASIPKPTNVPFRALKVWKQHPEFLNLLKESWNKSLQ